MKAAIAYSRTSTINQKVGHLAQMKAITTFAANEGMTLVGSYCDTASGCDDEREGLQKAIAHAKRIKAPILVLRIDRLGRKLSSLFSMLEDNNVRFVFTENGMNVDRFTLNILACVANAERSLISRRTKEALSRLKEEHKVQLGNRTNLNVVRLKGHETNRAKGTASKAKYAPILAMVKADGYTSIRKIGARLEELGIPTPTGKLKWNTRTIRRLLA